MSESNNSDSNHLCGLKIILNDTLEHIWGFPREVEILIWKEFIFIER